MIADVLFAAFAAVMWFVSASFPEGGSDAHAPALVPRICCAAIWFFALADVSTLCFRSFSRKGNSGGAPEAEDSATPNFLKLAALTFCYALLMPSVGFVAATGAYLAIALLVFGYGKPLVAFAFGYGAAALLYFVFAYLMNVSLPVGFLN